MRKKKILLLIHSNSFGGAEKILFWLAEKLCSNDNRVTIINLMESDNGTNYKREVSPSISILTPSGRKRIKHLNELVFTIKTIKKYKPDIVLSFTRLPNAVAGVSGWLTHTPTIISERSDPRVWYNSMLVAFLMKRASELAQLCVFQTEGAQAVASKIWEKKSTVIANPIFLPDDFVRDSKSFRNKTVVSLGRFENYQKRYDVLLDGFKIFHDKHPEYRLRLFGTGPDENQIKVWVHEKKLDDIVQFMGLSLNPFKDLKHDGIFTITSDFEGIPNSLLEAMSIGLPVVATDCEPGGARMLIQNNFNGLIVPKNDSAALAEALGRFADDEVFAESCASNAKDVINRFGEEKIFADWISAMDRVIGL